jgi:putative ABC transport system permease protein
LFGVGGSYVVANFAGWAMPISSQSIVLAVAFAAAIGVTFGFYPAHRASRLVPMEALRR